MALLGSSGHDTERSETAESAGNVRAMDLEAAGHQTHGDAPEHSEAIIDASGLATKHSEEGTPPRIPIIEVAFGEAGVTTERVNAANRDNSGGLHSADSPNPDAPAKSKSIDATGNTASIRKVALASDTEHGGAMLPGDSVYQGRLYRGVAASNPIFLPPEDFFTPQPQLWGQCACERICMRCVYDGEEFCEGCRAATLSVSSVALCDCEPGCCGLPGSNDLSEAEEITEVPS